MGIGFIISMVVTAVVLLAILAILIPFDRKYIIRKNRKIDFERTTVYLRWNVYDTVTAALAFYTMVCVQVLNILVSSG